MTTTTAPHFGLKTIVAVINIDFKYKVWWCPWKRRCRSWAPSYWHEMDECQYMAVVKALLGIISEEEYIAELFGIPTSLARRLDQWHVYILKKQVRWLDQGKAESSRIFVRKIGGLVAPHDALNGVTLQQFMTADTFFSDFAQTVSDKQPKGDVKRLARFVAALYMRKHESYFTEKAMNRRSFMDLPSKDELLVDIEGNAAMLERKTDYTTMWAVYLNWVMIRNWLARAYPLLFPEGDGDDKPQRRVRNAWLNIFDSFVGDDVAHLDNYRKMACTDAFRLMNRRIKEAINNKK